MTPPRRARVRDPRGLRRGAVDVVRHAKQEEEGRPVLLVRMHPADVQAIRETCNVPFRAILGIPIQEHDETDRGQVQLLRPSPPEDQEEVESSGQQ